MLELEDRDVMDMRDDDNTGVLCGCLGAFLSDFDIVVGEDGEYYWVCPECGAREPNEDQE